MERGSEETEQQGRRRPVTLRWDRHLGLPEDLRAALVGPGAPFEIRTEPVLECPLEVFVARPPHLTAVLERAAARFGDTSYLVFPDRNVSFAQALKWVAGVSHRLSHEFGIGKGDRVAVAAANSPEYAVTYWAVMCLGAVAVNLNGWWAGPELEYGIALTTPHLVLGDEERLDRLKRSGSGSGHPKLLTLQELAQELASDFEVGELPEARVDEDDPATVLFTSGTTGRPKAAVLSHRNIVHFGLVPALASAVELLGRGRVDAGNGPGERVDQDEAENRQGPPHTVSICGAPFFHISGTTPLLMTGGMHGATLVFPPPGRWDEVTYLRLTEQHQVTAWSVVPTQLWRLLEHPDFERFDLTSLRNIGAGGSNFPPELYRSVARRLPGVQVTNGYGMTETTGSATLAQPADNRTHPDAVGGPGPTMQIEIRTDEGGVLGEGESGEIWVRGATVFLGYLEDQEATSAVLDAQRWYRTGDLGRIEGGLLYLESRTGDRIIRGGENISAIEIENRLVEHPDIEDAAVVGVEDHLLGQVVKAVVVPRRGAELTEQTVRDWVGSGLARFKVPAHVELRSELPRTATGKVLKNLLVEPSASSAAPRPSGN